MRCDSYLEVYTICTKLLDLRVAGDEKDWRSEGTPSDLISIRRDQLAVFIEVGT